MSLSSELARNEYTGNGVATSFPITFSFFESTDLKVVRRNLDGTQTLLTSPANYSISGTDLIITPALANGLKVIVTRDMEFKQETEFTNQGAIHLDVIEDAIDRLTMLAQQLKEKASRSLTLAESTSGFDPTLPSEINTVIGATVVVNDAGNGFKVGPTTTEIANAQTYANDAADSAIESADSALAASGFADDAAASASEAAQSATDALAVYNQLITEIIGSKLAPTVISTQIAVNSRLFTTVYLKSNGGQVTLNLANIVGATINNQRILLIGTSDADFVTIEDGENGPVDIKNKVMVEYVYAENSIQEMWRNR